MSANGPLAVMHCLAPAPFGGAESVVQALSTGMLARRHDVHIVAVVEADGDRHPFVIGLREAGVPTTALTLPARAYHREWRELAALMRVHRPTLVHTHGFRSDVLGGLVARRAGLPIVTTVHGFTFGDLKNRFYEQIQRRAFRFFDAVVVVSAPLEQELLARGVPRGRLHLVPNSFVHAGPLLDRAEARRELGVPADEFRLGWLGRLSHEKGADVLVEALSRIGDAGISASVIGQGPQLDELRSAAEAADLRGVHWHGSIPRAARLLRAFDLVVLSSRTEGTPIVLLEAIEAGVPVLATRVGGIPAVVGDDEALLVPSEAPDALAAAILAVRDQPDAARRRAEAARRRLALTHDPASWLDAYEGIYRAVSRERSGC